MEPAMTTALTFGIAPERIEEGSPEERALFGLFTVHAGEAALTEGFDFFINSYRPGPLVSGYHAAEWIAWNWWRLRWEPKSASPGWWRAHRMNAIGEGYVWPNLTIFSDGVRTALISEPSSRPDAKPFRYLGSLPRVLPSAEFEAAVDAFLPQAIGRLRSCDVAETNLDRVWQDVLAERADSEIVKRRRLEALLGRDADQVTDDTIETLLADAASLGAEAVQEVAADHAQDARTDRDVLTASALRQIALAKGFDSKPRDSVRLSAGTHLTRDAGTAAWRLGLAAAQDVRAQFGSASAPLTNANLAQLAGAREAVLTDRTAGPEISFALDSGPMSGRIVLRSRWETGRRFDLARLIGDRVLEGPAGALHPSTRAYTYRQKAQRTFAAELLSPFEAVEDMLNGDYSPENQQDAAAHFQVSDLTIRTLLINHRRIERDLPDEDSDMAAA